QNYGAFVLFGSGSGFSQFASPDFYLWDLRAEYGGDGTYGFFIEDDSYYAGASAASAGDVNGDGYDDIIIGSPYTSSDGKDYNGRAYVIFGGAQGTFGGTFNLNALNGSNGFRINGDTSYGYLGTSVSSAGDVNGD